MHTSIVRRLEKDPRHPTPRWRAECPSTGCGWVGVDRPHEVQARHDATSHSARAESNARREVHAV